MVVFQRSENQPWIASTSGFLLRKSSKTQLFVGKQFVIGDIHGACSALQECLQKSGLSRDDDQLICLGDVCDGWPEVKESINELMTIKNLVYLLGNHDQWALNWMENGLAPSVWLMQGGLSTVKSYATGIPDQHLNFLRKALPWFESENRLFVHGGFDPDLPVNQQALHDLIWDRSLVADAWDNRATGKKRTRYQRVFVGHTPTQTFGSTKPIQLNDIWMLDTGAGWTGGYLTIMDTGSGEYWQSSRVDLLYPGICGR